MDIIEVSTGEVKAGDGEMTLNASAVGSCMIITAYDRKKKAGAMAHIMLPGKASEKHLFHKNRYAADAIQTMIHILKKKRADINDLEVCLAGGGNVLNKENDTICNAIISSVKKLIAEKGWVPKAEEIGGNLRRSVTLNISTGTVTYTEGDSSEKILFS